jgi:hypothetical protein
MFRSKLGKSEGKSLTVAMTWIKAWNRKDFLYKSLWLAECQDGSHNSHPGVHVLYSPLPLNVGEISDLPVTGKMWKREEISRCNSSLKSVDFELVKVRVS